MIAVEEHISKSTQGEELLILFFKTIAAKQLIARYFSAVFSVCLDLSSRRQMGLRYNSGPKV